jgi:hypothetical protein
MQLETAQDAIKYAFAGNATVTISSRKSGTHYTYKFSKPKDKEGDLYFVSALTGPDNETDFIYIGLAFKNRVEGGLKLTAKSKFSPDAPCVKAIDWALKQLAKGGHEDLVVLHANACGRCGRKLTTPQSIITGLGPECAKAA